MHRFRLSGQTFTPSLASILAMLAIEVRTSVMTVKAHDLRLLAAGADSSMPLSPTPQSNGFIRVEQNEVRDYPGYRLVEGA